MATHSRKTVLKQWPAAVKQKARNSSILEIEQAKEHSKMKHGSATNTNTTYDGYIRRGKQWLAGLVKDVEQEDELEHPRGCPAGLEGMKWKVVISCRLLTQDQTGLHPGPWLAT